MGEISVVIAAAGVGSRTGLPYPKTLFPIKGKPILVRLAELLAPYDAEPIVIINEVYEDFFGFWHYMDAGRLGIG